MTDAKHFFSKDEQQQIVAAISKAEKNTSGEIRVNIDNRCRGDVLDRAAEVFGKLGMDKTEQRNGVLIYLAVKDKVFAIIGDEGINRIVGNGFWNDVKDLMAAQFAQGNFCRGLIDGIGRCGEKLKFHFPIQPNDVNELSDEISFEA